MSSEVTFSTITESRREPTSTAWFWWKESRQLAPLLFLLVLVAIGIILLNVATGFAFSGRRMRLPGEIILLVFPGLFATGAGPLLVGQERAQGTLNWLVLLPISARRLITTKLKVGLAGLAIMWVFAFTLITLLGLSDSNSARWSVGARSDFSSNPFSYPVWILHSIFILLCGFFVAWKIKNQFNSLMALIALAFSPVILTSLIAAIRSRPMMSDEIDWSNLVLTLVGIGVMTPLTFHAAFRSLAPAEAPRVGTTDGRGIAKPSEINRDSVAPRFNGKTTPIIWQSLSSARGSLLIVCGLLAAALLAVSYQSTVPRTAEGSLTSIFWFLSTLAVSWLGISVFKHDGSCESIRFLADRGVSPRNAYLGLHAVPLAILAAALSLYGLLNLGITHLESLSTFSASLPTLLTLTLLVVLIYSTSQWISQLVRTLILSVILAPIASAMVAGWLIFTLVSWQVPIWKLSLAGLAPMAATWIMMRRYMDNRDRVSSLVVAAIVLAVLVLVPVSDAISSVRSVPGMDADLRRDLIAEARQQENTTAPAIGFPLSGMTLERDSRFDPFHDPMKELTTFMAVPKMRPMQVVAPLLNSDEELAAYSDFYSYHFWHDGICLSRINFAQSPDEDRWNDLAEWMEASATLLPALRRSRVMADQEIADRLEVLMIDTLQLESVQARNAAPAIQKAASAIGTPASRAGARRSAVLAMWLSHVDRERRASNMHQISAGNVPPGLMHWIQPRITESQTTALLEGISDSKNRLDDDRWRRALHAIHQTGGLYEYSRYGDAMRDRPAIDTMTISQITGFGQLWGRNWEYVDGNSLASGLKTADPAKSSGSGERTE